MPHCPTKRLHFQIAGFLVVPKVCKSRMAGRAFSYQAALLWNKLPVAVSSSLLHNVQIHVPLMLLPCSFSALSSHRLWLWCSVVMFSEREQAIYKTDILKSHCFEIALVSFFCKGQLQLCPWCVECAREQAACKTPNCARIHWEYIRCRFTNFLKVTVAIITQKVCISNSCVRS